MERVLSDGLRAFAAGRCHKGTIRVGTQFTQMRRMYPNESGRVPVQLTVTHIVFYGHDFHEITEGLTADLEIEGIIPEELDGWVLLT